MNKDKYQYRIYGRNKGRKKINKNIIANENFYKKFSFDLKRDIIKNKNIILDIGSGNGENAILLAKKNLKNLIVACDVFLDGNLNLCNFLYDNKIDNVKIYSKNVIELFDSLQDINLFSEVWILFPDPWPKKRHQKRRLIDKKFFNKVYPFLVNKSKIFIATDSTSYLQSIMQTIFCIKSFFRWINYKPDQWIYRYKSLPETKFYKKAEKSSRNSFLLELEKI